MAKGLTAQEQAAKWAANSSANSANYAKGISKVTSNPMAKAAQNLGKAKANYNAAIDSGRMANKLNNTSMEYWKQQAMSKGQTNYSTGVQNGVAKMNAALAKWVPIRNQIAATVQSMPTDTYEQRKARATAMMDGMHAAKMQGV